MTRSKKSIKVPENFKKILCDFTADLATTFPEIAEKLAKWNHADALDKDVASVYKYISEVYPERFFDMLYQNAEIFTDSSVNTCFLPEIEFKELFTVADVSDNTKQAIWKYLQLLTFSVTENIKSKDAFGENGNMFDGIDESELQSKLADALKDIGAFFKPETTDNGTPNPNLPSPEGILNNIKGLFDGKLGTMAKEMMAEMEDDIKDIFGDDLNSIKSPSTAFAKLVKNPKKMMDLMKKVSEKMKTKLSSGEISKEEMETETKQFLEKFKELGGDGMKDMFKNMTKGFGGSEKDMKFDTNAINRLQKSMDTKDRMREKLRKRQEDALKTENLKTDANGKMTFTTDEKQPKSSGKVTEDLDKIVDEIEKIGAKKSKKNKPCK